MRRDEPLLVLQRVEERGESRLAEREQAVGSLRLEPGYEADVGSIPADVRVPEFPCEPLRLRCRLARSHGVPPGRVLGVVTFRATLVMSSLVKVRMTSTSVPSGYPCKTEISIVSASM